MGEKKNLGFQRRWAGRKLRVFGDDGREENSGIFETMGEEQALGFSGLLAGGDSGLFETMGEKNRDDGREEHSGLFETTGEKKTLSFQRR